MSGACPDRPSHGTDRCFESSHTDSCVHVQRVQRGSKREFPAMGRGVACCAPEGLSGMLRACFLSLILFRKFQVQPYWGFRH